MAKKKKQQGGKRPGAGRKTQNGRQEARSIRVDAHRWATWKAAAASAGKPLNQWIREACDAMAAK